MDKPKAILKIAVAIKELGNAEKKGIAGVAELRYDWYDRRDVFVTPFASLERD